jgi:hypothetical protein
VKAAVVALRAVVRRCHVERPLFRTVVSRRYLKV